MSERRASETALGVAALRAAHRVADGEPKILDDPIAARLLDEDDVRRLAEEPPREYRGRGLERLRVHVLVRSRYAEDRLAEAVADGVRQYVILGAGYDTFAYRQPAWSAGLRIFEVDLPASQEAKRRRLSRAAIPEPPNVRFVTADLEDEALLARLVRHGFDPAEPAFFSCLGVLVYLRAEAAERIFRLVASLPPRSEIVFTFAPPEATLDAAAAERRARLARAVEAAGEPWRTHFVPEELVRHLRALGFSEVHLPDRDELHDRYFRGRTDGLEAPVTRRIADAVR